MPEYRDIRVHVPMRFGSDWDEALQTIMDWYGARSPQEAILTAIPELARICEERRLRLAIMRLLAEKLEANDGTD